MCIHPLEKEIIESGNPEKAVQMQRFFKTGKGKYGEGDLFLGMSNPQVRVFAKNNVNLSLPELAKLIRSKFHEVRAVAILVMVYKYPKVTDPEQKKLYEFYLANTKYINNWDLVDLSAHYVFGRYLVNRNREILYKLAKSELLWERRIAIISTFAFIRNKEYKDTFEICKILLTDKEDLMHKACGWMLREVGKHSGQEVLKHFLDENLARMPRTMLRYAIEKFPENIRLSYLKQKPSQK